MKLRVRSSFSLMLVSLGLAWSCLAIAQCPATVSPPWTSTSVGGGASTLSVTSGGYDGTSCRLLSSLGASGTARAQVRTDTPTHETHYRGQFIFDPVNLSGAGGTNQVNLLLANAPAPFNGQLSLLRMQYSGSGGGTKRLILIGACNNGGSSTCLGQANLATQNGPNRIEFDLTVGPQGTLRYWITPVGTATSENSPTGSVTLTGGNAGWGGVDTVYLGLTSPSRAYRDVNTGVAAYFDQFDSRRTTFIGH